MRHVHQRAHGRWDTQKRARAEIGRPHTHPHARSQNIFPGDSAAECDKFLGFGRGPLAGEKGGGSSGGGGVVCGGGAGGYWEWVATPFAHTRYYMWRAGSKSHWEIKRARTFIYNIRSQRVPGDIINNVRRDRYVLRLYCVLYTHILYIVCTWADSGLDTLYYVEVS